MKDYNDFFEDYDRDQARGRAKLPVCSVCREPIQDDFLYVIDDEIICEECLRENFRKSTDDFIGE